MSKPFKLPESVPILYHEYKVKRVKNLTLHTDLLDTCLFETGELWLDGDLEGTRLKELFWHTVIERLMKDMEMKVDHPLYCAFIQGLLPIMDAVQAYQEGE